MTTRNWIIISVLSVLLFGAAVFNFVQWQQNSGLQVDKVALAQQIQDDRESSSRAIQQVEQVAQGLRDSNSNLINQNTELRKTTADQRTVITTQQNSLMRLQADYRALDTQYVKVSGDAAKWQGGGSPFENIFRLGRSLLGG